MPGSWDSARTIGRPSLAWPISFDSQTPQPFFKGSKVSELERVKRVLKAASNDPYAVAQMLGRRIGTDFGNLVIPLPGTSEVLSYAFTCPCQTFFGKLLYFRKRLAGEPAPCFDSQGLRLGAFTELIPSSETLRRMNGNTVLGNSGQVHRTRPSRRKLWSPAL